MDHRLFKEMIRAFVQCLQKLLTFIAEVEQSRPNKALQLHMTTSLSLIKSIREWVAATRDVLSLLEGVVAPSTVPAPSSEPALSTSLILGLAQYNR